MPIEEIKLIRNPITEKLQNEIEYLHTQNGVLVDALIVAAASAMPLGDGKTIGDIIKQWIDKAFELKSICKHGVKKEGEE